MTEIINNTNDSVYLSDMILPLQIKLREILRHLGRIDRHVCLEVSGLNGVISHQLRKVGGDWHTVVMDETTAAAARELAPDNIYCMGADSEIPFKKKMFDVVVLVNVLERLRNDEDFIEQCHKILKPDGRLVVVTGNVKQWSVLGIIQKLIGATHQKKGRVRPGYTESELFGILKHGFDLHSMRTFSRFFVELVDLIADTSAGRAGRYGPARRQRIRKIYSVSRVLFWLAFQLDFLLLPTKGFSLIASAKRRAWRPRNAPVLVDGRSITEAVLSRADG